MQIHQQKQKAQFENAIARGLRNEAYFGRPKKSEGSTIEKKSCGGCKKPFPMGKLNRTPL